MSRNGGGMNTPDYHLSLSPRMQRKRIVRYLLIGIFLQLTAGCASATRVESEPTENTDKIAFSDTESEPDENGGTDSDSDSSSGSDSDSSSDSGSDQDTEPATDTQESIDTDECLDNPDKTEPGVCGCAMADDDDDGDGTLNCQDDCPNDGNKIVPGECGCGVVEGTCQKADSLDDALGAPNGAMDFELGGVTHSLYVDGNYDGGGWILVGRGREGWAWSENGMGKSSTLWQELGTPAAFPPAYLATATIGQLITNANIDLRNVEIRIKRAAATDGSSYQEVRWRSVSNTTWTWLFDTNQYDIEHTFFECILGPGGAVTANTEDVWPSTENNHQRIFTWGWDSHNNKRGFSHGSDVTGGTDTPENFFWQHGGENHAIPYSEVYIRYVTP